MSYQNKVSSTSIGSAGTQFWEKDRETLETSTGFSESTLTLAPQFSLPHHLPLADSSVLWSLAVPVGGQVGEYL
jgi:hypothetical protein